MGEGSRVIARDSIGTPDLLYIGRTRLQLRRGQWEHIIDGGIGGRRQRLWDARGGVSQHCHQEGPMCGTNWLRKNGHRRPTIPGTWLIRQGGARSRRHRCDVLTPVRNWNINKPKVRKYLRCIVRQKFTRPCYPIKTLKQLGGVYS